MQAEMKEGWLDALRSGQYKQGTGALLNGNDEFCCLGVLCDVAGISRDSICLYATLEGIGRVDLLPGALERGTLISMNDYQGKTFAEIADWIEANIPVDP